MEGLIVRAQLQRVRIVTVNTAQVISSVRQEISTRFSISVSPSSYKILVYDLTNISVINAAQARQVGRGDRTSISCTVSGITRSVSVVWKNEGTIVQTNDKVITTAGTFSSNSQTHTLEILSPDSDTTYTCEVTSADYPKEAEKEKTINVFVFGKLALCESLRRNSGSIIHLDRSVT